MHYEVEQKFPAPDLEAIKHAIIQRGATEGPTVTQVDTYYAHPVRDYATTDEALRIRRVDDKNVFTYKGPKIDATTKTRQEIELEFADGLAGAEQGDQLLESLGFRRVANVSKVRQTYHLQQADQSIEFALDTIAGLGTYVELEIIAEGEDEMQSAQQTIKTLATDLNLTQPERSSYLELLLEQ